MEQHNDTLMTPFDHLISSQELQMLKLLIPYTPPSNQPFLAVYVKFMEFQRTLSVFQGPKHTMQMQSFQTASSSPLDMLSEMKPYLPKEHGERLEQVLNMMSMMDMVSSFQEMNQQSDGPDMNPMDLMKGMLSPEQQEMFNVYNTMFSGDTQNESENEKGYENNGYERMDESPFNGEYGPDQTTADSDGSRADRRQKREFSGSGSDESDYGR